MFAKRALLLTLITAVVSALGGCCHRKSSCRTDDTRYYDPNYCSADPAR